MKLERMVGILSLLLQRDRITAPELAEHFEVSRRTINRDIEALNLAGIPVETQQGAGGGIRLSDSWRMNRLLLSPADLQAILAGLRGLDSVSGTSRYRQLMSRLAGGADGILADHGSILVSLASWYHNPLSGKISLLREAIEEHRCVSFHYYSPEGDSHRTVEPALLVFQWSSWYLWGWCRLRQAPRLFKLNRMEELQTSGAFLPRQLPAPDLSADRVFPENYRVVALVRSALRWRLIEEYGPGSFTQEPDGRLRFSAGFTNRDSVLSWILSMQGEAELIEPAELREELRKAGEKISACHANMPE